MKTTIKKWCVILAVAAVCAGNAHAIAIGDVLARFKDWYDRGCRMSPGSAGAPASGANNSGGNQAFCGVCATGMPRWWVDEPYINLHITDEPLSYTMASGQRMSFKFLYKQRFMVPTTNECAECQTTYNYLDHYAQMRTYGMTNAAWGHSWMADILVWDAYWQANYDGVNYHYQTNHTLYSDSYEALAFMPDGGMQYFYKNLGGPGGQNNQSDSLSQVGLVPRSSSGYPKFTYSPTADTNGIYWGTDTNIGFVLNYPDGSQDVFALAIQEAQVFVGNPGQNTAAHAFLTQKIDAQGRTYKLGYEYVAFPNTNTPSYYAFRLKYVVDWDGRTNTFQYNVSSPKHAWQVSEIDDPYGRSALLTYDATSGRLSSITDAAANTNSFSYQSDNTGWITGMTTPYGTTSFEHYQNPSYSVSNLYSQRATYVSQPNSASQLFCYIHQATNGVPSSMASPTNVAGPIVFDNGSGTNADTSDFALTYRNSFHWDERQFSALSVSASSFASSLSNAVGALTAADFKKGHLSHWLLGQDYMTVSESLSSERDPSPDSGGTIDGSWTWYNYANKFWGVEAEGDSQVTVIARFLPDGTTRYSRYDYLAGLMPRAGLVGDNALTYTTSAGTNAELVTTFTYATNNIDLVTVSNSAGQYIKYGYNGYHQITAITNALNEVTQMSWGGGDGYSINTLSLPNGQNYTLWYYPFPTHLYPLTNTSSFLAIVQVAPEGLEIDINDYTNGSPRITHVSGTGLTDLWVTNTWDAMDRLTGTSFQDGSTISNIYNVLNLTGQKDRLGNWTYYGYDALEHLTYITNALTNVTTLNWCSCGALTGISDALTNTTTLSYDNQGRLTNALYPDYSSVTYQLDLLGRATNVFDGTGRYARMTYNNQGLVTTVSNAAGLVSKVVYDALDRPLTVTDADNVTVTNTFDLLNRLVVRSWSDGTNEGWVYSTNGLVAYTNRDSKVTRYTRDGASRITTVSNANLERITFSYDPLDRLTSVTDGLGHVRGWRYDQYGRLTGKTDNSGNDAFRFAYNANGWLTNRWTPGSTNTSYAYDVLGNLTNINYPGSVTPSVAMAYNAVNWLTNLVDGIGTNTFTYTNFGQLTSESFQTGNTTVSNAYTQGARTSMAIGAGAGAMSFSYGYDAVWRLQTLNSPAGTFNYGYQASASTLVTGIGQPNGASIVNQYDSFARLTNTALQNYWGHVLDGYGYTYGRADYRTGVTRSLGLTTNSISAGYDNIGQLISSTGSESGGVGRLNEQFGYGYDAAHNLSSRTNNALVQTFGVDAFDELTSISRSGTLTVSGNTPAPATNVSVNGYAAALYGDLTFAATNFVITNAGSNTFTIKATNVYNFAVTNTLNVNLPTNVALAYDTNGNLTGDGTRTFYYDAENRLTNVFVTNQWKTEFAYDGFGRRRIERDYTWNGSTWSRTNETRYIFDGLLPIQERDSNNAVLVTYTRGLDFSGGLNGAGGIGGLLARTDASSSTYYHSDGSGNVTALMDGVQNIVARYEYDPYGRQIGQWGKLAGANTMRFSSMGYSVNSGLVGYHARFYEPGFQRWLNRDPIGEAGGVNLYGFVGNDVENSLDPFGLCKVEIRYSKLGTFIKSWYHAYVVVTDVNSRQTYYRGGGAGNGPSDRLTGWSGQFSQGGALLFSAPGGAISQKCSRGSQSKSSNSSNSSSPGSSPPGQNAGPWGRVDTMSGPYVKGSIDWDPKAISVVIWNDDKPCDWVKKRFEDALDKIDSRNIPYNPLGDNSNAVAHDIIENAGFQRPTPPVWAPGSGNRLVPRTLTTFDFGPVNINANAPAMYRNN